MLIFCDTQNKIYTEMESLMPCVFKMELIKVILAWSCSELVFGLFMFDICECRLLSHLVWTSAASITGLEAVWACLWSLNIWYLWMQRALNILDSLVWASADFHTCLELVWKIQSLYVWYLWMQTAQSLKILESLLWTSADCNTCLEGGVSLILVSLCLISMNADYALIF